MILELSEIEERLLRLTLTNEREIILSEIAKTASQKLEDQPMLNQKIDSRETLLNQKIDSRETLLKSVELFSLDPLCQEVIILELIETNWGDEKPKEETIIVTSKVFTPSTIQMEQVYDFSLNPFTENGKQEYVGGGTRQSQYTQIY